MASRRLANGRLAPSTGTGAKPQKPACVTFQGAANLAAPRVEAGARPALRPAQPNSTEARPAAASQPPGQALPRAWHRDPRRPPPCTSQRRPLLALSACAAGTYLPHQCPSAGASLTSLRHQGVVCRERAVGGRQVSLPSPVSGQTGHTRFGPRSTVLRFSHQFWTDT